MDTATIGEAAGTLAVLLAIILTAPAFTALERRFAARAYHVPPDALTRNTDGILVPKGGRR